MTDSDRDHIRQQAQIDQAMATMAKQVSPALKAFYDSLVAAGFAHIDAMDLTEAWMLQLVGGKG